MTAGDRGRRREGGEMKKHRNETWNPLRPFTVRHDGVGWSIYHGKQYKVYQFGGDSRGQHDAEIAKRLMNTAYRDGRHRVKARDR
jgi:hypothetical protein